MALTKMVNGIKVDCTPQEEAEIRAEWAFNKIESDKQIAKDIADKQQYDEDRANATAKLISLGFSDDEISLIIKSK